MAAGRAIVGDVADSHALEAAHGIPALGNMMVRAKTSEAVVGKSLYKGVPVRLDVPRCSISHRLSFAPML